MSLGEAKLRHPGRVQDQAHRVILSAEDHGVSDAMQSFEIVDHVEERIVGDKDGVFRGIAGAKRDDRQQVRRHFLDRNALADNFGRQLGLRQLLAVLGLYLRDVHICPNLERELDGHVPVICAGGIVVEKVIDSGKLHFDRARDGIRDYFRARTWIVRLNLDNGRRDFRKLSDGQTV